MVSLPRFLPALPAPQPFVTNLSAPITVAIPPPPRPVAAVTLAEPTPRRAGLAPLSAPGTVKFAGLLYNPTEKERVWQDQRARDEILIEMGSDPIIGGVLRQIAMFIRRVPWYVDPADDSDEAKQVAEFYQDCLSSMRGLWPGDTMARMLTFLQWGWSACEVVYTRRDDGKIGWKYWRLIPQETRWGWRFDDEGEATHLIQLDPESFKEIEVPLSRTIHLRDATRNNSPEGFSPLRIAYQAYAFRLGFQQLEGSLFERFGGVQVARLPEKDIENNTSAYQEMQRIVTTLGINSQTGLVLSSKRDDAGEFFQDFEIVAPPAGATVPSADPIINRYANELVGVFGANLTRTGQDGTGSYALADVQSGMFQQNMAAYLDLIGDEITSQEFPRLAVYNSIRPELVPKLRHGDIEDADLERLGAYIEKLSGAELLERTPELRFHVHDEAGLPVPSIDELRELEEERKAEEEQAAKDAEKARQDALKAAQGAQTPQEGTDTENVTPMRQRADGGAVAASERVRTLIEDDGSVTLADLMEVAAWWNRTVPEYAGILNAKILTDG